MKKTVLLSFKSVTLLVVCIILSYSSAFSQKAWNQKANFPGGVRNNGVAFSINGKGYMGMGQNSTGTRYSDFYEYNPTTNTWTQMTAYPGGNVAGATAFAINGKGYVCFGVNGAGVSSKELWEYTPGVNTWTQKASCPGSARFSPGNFVINDTAFVLCGNASATPYLSEVYMYVPATNTWTKKANYGGGPRSIGAGFTIDGIGYFGAGLTSATSLNKDVWKYNKSKDTWAKIADLPVAISGVIAFGIDEKGYLGTGYNLTTNTKEVYEYDPATDKWTKVDSIPAAQPVRSGGMCFVIDRTAYYGAGYGTNTSTSQIDIWAFTPKLKCLAKIVTKPTNQTVNVYDTARFIAIAGDANASYRWQINSGGGFSDLSNGGQYSGAQTGYLVISNVKFSTDHNHKFRCITKNSLCSDTSSAVNLSVVCLKLVSGNPVSVNSTNGSTVKFGASSIVQGSTFQWQKNTGSGFTNISNSGQYSGANKDTLTVSDLVISDNSTKYRNVFNFGGCLDTSSVAILGVSCNPILKVNPSSKTVYKGTNARFGVMALENGTTFQWQVKIGSAFQNLTNAGQFSGSTSDSLQVSSTTIFNKMQEYRCILSYKSCSDTSKGVILDVLCNPIVSSSPADQNKFEAENTSFTVSSFDSKADAEWQIDLGTGFLKLNNSGQFSNVGTYNLNISNLALTNNNQKFRCVLSAEGCFDTSKSATLKVICKPMVLTNPVSKTAFVSDNISFNVTSADLNAARIWQADNGFGFQNLSNAGQFQGVSKDSLEVLNLTLANNNQKFRCIFSTSTCKDTSESALLNVKCNTLIADQPVDKLVYVASNTFFSVISKDPKSTYQWQSDIGFGFQNLSNAGQFNGVTTDTLRVLNVTMANDKQTFRCLLSTGACDETSDVSALKINTGSITKVANNVLVVYPNPGNNYINVKLSPEFLNSTYKIIDQQGRIVMSNTLTENITLINIENLAVGVYILQTEPVQTRILIIKK